MEVRHISGAYPSEKISLPSERPLPECHRPQGTRRIISIAADVELDAIVEACVLAGYDMRCERGLLDLSFDPLDSPTFEIGSG
jgi:hypothetical protein